MTRKVREQAFSKYSHLTYNGKTQSLTEWAYELKIDRSTLWSRLHRGMPVEKALACDMLNEKLLEYRGQKKSISQWAEETGIARHTIMARLRYGWTVERALETPVIEPEHRRTGGK